MHYNGAYRLTTRYVLLKTVKKYRSHEAENTKYYQRPHTVPPVLIPQHFQEAVAMMSNDVDVRAQ